ncbi:cyclic nucleotide-binding domain-containing protein [Devosia sp.]|uniref:cyclic nucleotide-binding domain-containing protein n=1 Tax=Devosia sp. TaxID=1871048 RepID=UPI002F23769F
MSSLLALTRSQPRRTLDQGEALITEGDEGGELYVLESGRLDVVREGVVIASIDEPGALIGEMAVLLGTDHSATVRAETAVSVRVIEDPIPFLERTPLVALQVATLACARLDATSALLVELKKETQGRPGEQSLLSRIFSAISAVPPEPGARQAAHE